MSEMNLLPVFVYGSLRQGANGASGIMADATYAGPWQAYAKAELRYHECKAYPVLIGGKRSVTRGDLVLVDENSSDWRWLFDMEVDAGYAPRWITVVARQSDGEWRPTQALAFMWEHEHDGLEVVEGGDWLKAEWGRWPRRR